MGDSTPTTTTISENVPEKDMDHHKTTDEDKKNAKALQLLTDDTTSCSNETAVSLWASLHKRLVS